MIVFRLLSVILFIMYFATGSDVFGVGTGITPQMNGYIDDLLIPEHLPDEIIVKFRDDIARNEAALENASKNAHSQAGAIIKRQFHQVRGLELVAVPDRQLLRQAFTSYLKNPEVEFAEPNYIVRTTIMPDDPDFNDLWGLHNDGQTGGTVDADIDAPEAWDIVTGSSDIIIAVIDTGVDYNHVDLASNIWVNTDEIPDNGIDDDSNGYVDDDIGWDFSRCARFNSQGVCISYKLEDNDPYDDHSHGTHCAGIIGAAGNNGTGVTGVNWEVQIMPLKFINSYGQGTTADAINAIFYAVDNGATILNNSWGGSGYSSSLRIAIEYAYNHDVLFVAAAGNNGTNNDVSPFYPASYDVQNVIAVAATNTYDSMPSWSNYGASSVDLAAPGAGIWSTMPGNSYAFKSGTSMATPYVSGVAGLIRASNPLLSNEEIIDVILDNVDAKSSLIGRVTTQGRLNAFRAVSNACPSLPARVVSTSTEYLTLRDAYIAAGSSDIIEAQASTFNEILNIDLNKSITIKGGYDCFYSSNNAAFTVLNGMSVTEGTLTIENVILN